MNVPTPSAAAPRSAFTIFRSVVFAMFVRELQTRFGASRLGYLWAILEPAAQVIVLEIVFGFAGRRALPGVDFPVFIITGVVPFSLFRQVLRQSMEAVDANRALFGYRQVKPIDGIVARVLLETVVYAVVFALLVWGAALFGYDVSIQDPIGFLGIMGLLLVFSAGLGIVFCVLGSLFRELKRLVPLLLTPLFFISGVFFSIGLIPLEYRPYLLWNPILHAIELSRDRYFPNFDAAPEASLAFLTMCAITALLAGLSLYRVKRLALVTT